MTDRIKSSFAAWGIYDIGHEYEMCLEVCTSQSLARQRLNKAQKKGSDRIGHTGFQIKPTRLLVHDGAHAVTKKMYQQPNAANASASAVVNQANVKATQ